MVAEADSETRFQLSARCGAGKDARDLALLAKSASRVPSHNFRQMSDAIAGDRRGSR